jgi:hypothetical protein
MGNSVQNFFTSRDNNTDPATYVGQLDRLWYNPDTNQIFVSDGTTPGGQPVDLGANANALINTLTVSTITSTSGTVNLTGDISITGNISPATTTKIGGVKAGPGANISNDGTLTIDTTGLPLSFGDFTANLNILTLVNEDQNMILATKGSAEVQLVGNIGFYKTDGFPPNVANRYFQATDDGQVRFLVPNTDPVLGAVEIVGSSSGNSIAPGITGAMLHVTGQLDIPCRLYYDGNGDYVSWVARRWNGNVATPTQVLAGEDILRINATAATDAGVGNVATVQISAAALENQTTTAQGSELSFIVTPVGQTAANRVEVANITVANGVTATKFTTAGTVIATGNISGGNVLTAGLMSATGGITSGDGISDSLGSVRSIPQNGKSANYTLEATDNGRMINITTGNVTIPAGVFASPFGQTVSIFNNQNASNAVVQGAGVTLRLAGTAATGNRTMARYGLSTIVCVAANTFVISGAGLT